MTLQMESLTIHRPCLAALDVQAPAQQAALNEQEIRKDVKERELNMKFQSYCDHVSGYCDGLFRTIDTKYKMAVIPRSHGFLVTIPHSYQGQLPEGAKETVYVKAVVRRTRRFGLNLVSTLVAARRVGGGWGVSEAVEGCDQRGGGSGAWA